MESHGSKKIIKREKGFCLENVMMMVIGWSKIFSGFAFLMDEKQKEHKAKKTDPIGENRQSTAARLSHVTCGTKARSEERSAGTVGDE